MSDIENLQAALVAVDARVEKITAEVKTYKSETGAEIAALKEQLAGQALPAEVFETVARIEAKLEALDAENPDAQVPAPEQPAEPVVDETADV